MPKQEGNAHGRHYTEEEHEEDEKRNFNESTGRQHFEADEHQKAGGHSDRHASSLSDTGGQQHEFSHEGKDDDEDRDNKPQDVGRHPGGGRNQGGRNQP